MKFTVFGRVLIAGLVVVFILSAFGVGSIVHESDQASFMDGAWQLAFSEGEVDCSSFYSYGKFAGAYGLLAAIYRIFPAADPVFSANVFSFSVFWFGVLAACLFRKPYTSLVRLVMFIAVVCSPAILVHVPYFSANFISAGLLLLGVSVVGSRFPLALVFWGGAMLVRIDAVLLVPLLAWIACREASFLKLVRSPRSWSIAAMAIGMLLLGRFLDSGAASIGYTPFFMPKLFAGYTVFGLGGGILVLVGILVLLVRQGAASELDGRLFWWSGCGAVLIPFVFYSMLLFSTRHWVVGLAGLLLFICSAHWETLEERMSWGWAAVALLVAILPLGIGLRLPFPTQPSLTVRSPTLFPSADGRCPMGAVFPFMFSGDRLDHNHQIWLAAGQVQNWNRVAGEVPVGASPLDTIVMFSIRSRGMQPSKPMAVESLSSGGSAYFPSRTLLKSRVRLDQSSIEPLKNVLGACSVEMVAGAFPSGIVSLVHAENGVSEPSALAVRIVALRRLFGGDELVWLGEIPAGPMQLDEKAQGCRMGFFANEPFHAVVGDDIQEAVLMPDVGVYGLNLSGRDWFGKHLSISSEVFAAHSVYPDYMSVQELKNPRSVSGNKDEGSICSDESKPQ